MRNKTEISLSLNFVQIVSLFDYLSFNIDSFNPRRVNDDRISFGKRSSPLHADLFFRSRRFQLHSESHFNYIQSGTCEWSKIEVSKVFSRGSDTSGRATTGRSPFSQTETSGRNYARSIEENTSGFPRHPARLSIQAPRNFYYRARGAREGLPIYSRFRKFCLLLEIKDSSSSGF